MAEQTPVWTLHQVEVDTENQGLGSARVDCPTELVTQKCVSHISQEVGGIYQFEWFSSEFEPLTARCSGGGGRVSWLVIQVGFGLDMLDRSLERTDRYTSLE